MDGVSRSGVCVSVSGLVDSCQAAQSLNLSTLYIIRHMNRGIYIYPALSSQ